MKTLRYLCLPVLLVAFGCQTSPQPSPDLLEINRFQPAAERGDRQAQYDLGAAYASQWRPIEASQWFRKAAEQGSPEAAYRLAVNYFRGEGVSEDVTEAYAWFDVAAAQGHVLAVNARESLAGRMSHAEIGTGNRRAAVLIAKIPPQNLRYALASQQNAAVENRQPANSGSTPPKNTVSRTSQSSSPAVRTTTPVKSAAFKEVQPAKAAPSPAPASLPKRAPQFEPVDATEAMPVVQP